MQNGYLAFSFTKLSSVFTIYVVKYIRLYHCLLQNKLWFRSRCNRSLVSHWHAILINQTDTFRDTLAAEIPQDSLVSWYPACFSYFSCPFTTNNRMLLTRFVQQSSSVTISTEGRLGTKKTVMSAVDFNIHQTDCYVKAFPFQTLLCSSADMR